MNSLIFSLKLWNWKSYSMRNRSVCNSQFEYFYRFLLRFWISITVRCAFPYGCILSKTLRYQKVNDTDSTHVNGELKRFSHFSGEQGVTWHARSNPHTQSNSTMQTHSFLRSLALALAPTADCCVQLNYE